MRRLSSEGAQALAAEYALGTLRGQARKRLETMARADRSLAATLARWEQSLALLAQAVPAVEPPRRVWEAIEARLAPRASRGAAVSLWRSFALMAGGLATVLLVAFLWLNPQRSAEPVLVAVLASPDSVPRVVVSMQPRDGLQVRVVNPWKSIEGKALELWALPKDGAPRSLGLVANAGETMLAIATADRRMAGAAAFAVSLEPPGGSPTGAPTGPVLCSGAIATVRKT